MIRALLASFVLSTAATAQTFTFSVDRVPGNALLSFTVPGPDPTLPHTGQRVSISCRSTQNVTYINHTPFFGPSATITDSYTRAIVALSPDGSNALALVLVDRSGYLMPRVTPFGTVQSGPMNESNSVVQVTNLAVAGDPVTLWLVLQSTSGHVNNGIGSYEMLFATAASVDVVGEWLH